MNLRLLISYATTDNIKTCEYTSSGQRYLLLDYIYQELDEKLRGLGRWNYDIYFDKVLSVTSDGRKEQVMITWAKKANALLFLYTRNYRENHRKVEKKRVAFKEFEAFLSINDDEKELYCLVNDYDNYRDYVKNYCKSSNIKHPRILYDKEDNRNFFWHSNMNSHREEFFDKLSQELINHGKRIEYHLLNENVLIGGREESDNVIDEVKALLKSKFDQNVSLLPPFIELTTAEKIEDFYHNREEDYLEKGKSFIWFLNGSEKVLKSQWDLLMRTIRSNDNAERLILCSKKEIEKIVPDWEENKVGLAAKGIKFHFVTYTGGDGLINELQELFASFKQVL